MAKKRSVGDYETRRYDTAEQARQAWDALHRNGANCTYTESGGDADSGGRRRDHGAG